MSELVSVIIRTKDRPHFLEDAISSVYCQIHKNIELIIINDGGVSIKELTNKWQDKIQINLIEFDKNKGRSKAANEGIKLAKGEFICFLDDDDIFYPNHISTLITEATDQFKVVYSDALKAIQMKDQKDYKTFDFFLDYSVDHSFKRMLEGNFIAFQSLLFKSEVLKNNLVDESLNVLEDWDLLIRVSKDNEFKHIKKITSEYRIRLDNSNTTGQNLDIWESARKFINNKYSDLVEGQGLKIIPTK